MLRGRKLPIRLAALGLAASVMTPGVARAEWNEAKSRHFTIYSGESVRSITEFAERLEKFDFLLRRVTGVTGDEAVSPVRVFVLPTVSKVTALANNRNVRGFYRTSDRFAYAVQARGNTENEYDLGAQEVLFHEYAHHFMLSHFPAAYPAWYVEGFAEFFSVVKFPKDGGVTFGNIPVYRAPGLVLGSIYPLEGLLTKTAEGMNGPDGDRFYGTAWLLTHYYHYGKTRSAEIKRYLNDVATGVPDMKLDSYFAGGVKGLEKDLRAYMRKGLAASKLTEKVSTGEIGVRAVDAAQGELIEDELEMSGRLTDAEKPGLLRSVRQVAAKYPTSAYALATLAELEWKADEKDAALADADRAIAIDPKLSRAHSVRAEILLERANDSGKPDDWKAALSAIVKANRADLNDPVPLELFCRYHRMKGGAMPKLGYDGLEMAFRLLPQNPNYRFAYAAALADRGDYAVAARVLDPIAYSPHGSEMREAALKMKAGYLARVVEKSAGAAVGSQ